MKLGFNLDTKKRELVFNNGKKIVLSKKNSTEFKEWLDLKLLFN